MKRICGKLNHFYDRVTIWVHCDIRVDDKSELLKVKVFEILNKFVMY